MKKKKIKELQKQAAKIGLKNYSTTIMTIICAPESLKFTAQYLKKCFKYPEEWITSNTKEKIGIENILNKMVREFHTMKTHTAKSLSWNTKLRPYQTL